MEQDGAARAGSDAYDASAFADLTVLITGGSGLLGSHLCRALLARGARLHATSRVARRGPPRWWRLDLLDVDELRGLFARVRPDLVYHFAGVVTAVPDRTLVLPTYHSLLTTTVNLLLAASEQGCGRVVLAGSLTAPIEPRTPPGSPYAAAKAGGNLYGRLFDALFDLPVVMPRLFMTYGPNQAAGKLIPYVIQSLLRGEVPQLSSGRLQADWIYVEDAIDALMRAGVLPGLDGMEFDVGSGKLVSVREVVLTVTRLLRTSVVPRFGGLPDRTREISPVADVETSSRLLSGWRPGIDLEQGLLRTIESIRGAPDCGPG